MRLLFCTTDGAGAFNGINAWLLDFLPALAAAGHQPSVLVFSWSPARSCHTYPRLRERGIPARVVFPMLYTEAAVRRCLREVHRSRPDVFVANMVTPALLALPAIRALGIPGVSILHNDDAEYRAKASFPADATVSISRGLSHLTPADSRLRACIPYGVPISPRQSTPPAKGQPLRLIYHGRIAAHQKRIVETAAALARVCRAIPSAQADIYGSGPDEALLRKQLAREDADGRVRFLGPRTTTEIKALLPAYHVAVLLSDFEGLGLSILEAMSAGLVPVCLRTASGLPDILHHEKNGLFVTDRDADFDTAIARLALDPELWLRLSRAALKTIHNDFSTAACLQSWENLFRDLVALPHQAASAPNRLPAPHQDLLAEDKRHPGLRRALWRWFRFGRTIAPRPW